MSACRTRSAAARVPPIAGLVALAAASAAAAEGGTCAAGGSGPCGHALLQTVFQKGILQQEAHALLVEDDSRFSVLGLPGPNFTQGDASWRERREELVRRHPHIFSADHLPSNEDPVALASAAPLTVLYILAHNQGRLFPNGAVPKTMRIHVLGAAYPFEGRGDWQILGEAMPPGVSLDISLVLGTPGQADGVPEIERLRQQKRKLCREHGIVKVRCIESYYQDVMEELEPPHLAVMFNPGFPQVHRRTWDKTLLYLIKERIPSAVSAQVTNKRGWPTAGEPWDSSFLQYDDEDFPINATLMAYGADTWGATGSPFPIVELEDRDGEDEFKIVKNGVIELFQGLREGASLPPPPPAALPPKEVEFLEHFDWAKAERKMGDPSIDGMRDALMTPVSDGFVVAADNVYLQYLKQEMGRGTYAHKPRKVLEKVNSLIQRMERSEPLESRDWIFLKSNLGLD